MAIMELARDDWHPFFENLTRTVRGRQAQVEVASLSLGDQHLAHDLALLGISYDTRGDSLEIALDGLDHRVARPAAIWIDSDMSGGVLGLEAVGEEDARTIVRLHAPLLLPPPEQASPAA